MSVLFVMPPGGVIPSYKEHLGIAFLRAMLARSGIAAEQYLPARSEALPAFARLLATRRPRVVGFTAYESNLRGCRAMARVVRACLPEAVLLVGGPNATFSPEETLELLGADACLRGAGEGTIAPVVSAILGAPDARRRLPELLAAVPNLVLRTDGCVERTRQGDLSSFPGEYFGCLDDLPSPYQEGLLTTGDVGLLTARGCNQHCTYCSFAAISGRRVHFHGVERVLDDLAAYQAHLGRLEQRPASVSILDDAFTLAPARAREICEGIIGRGLQLPLNCETRADRVDPDLLRLMRRAGFDGIFFGLESAVPRVLRTIGKVQDPATTDDPGFEAERAWLDGFRQSVEAALEAGLTPSVSVIGGLPGEDADDFRATLAFVETLHVPSYAHNILAMLPGTPLHRDGQRHGLRAGRDPATGRWLTHHAYDVRAVAPLPNAQLRGECLSEARLLADALCGRPRPDLAAEGAAWAVVLHGGAPDPAVAAWLREVLAVQGALLVLDDASGEGAASWRRWTSLLLDAAVPFGPLIVLSPEPGLTGGLRLRSVGTLGDHRFEVETAWPSSGRRIEVDAAGNCQVPVWLAADPAARPPGPGPEVPFDRVPQIADGCRWWTGWRRCSAPRVLHVRPDGAVAPCWHGPSIGRVGDCWDKLAAQALALGSGEAEPPASGPCPMGSGCGASAELEHYEVAAQVAWRHGAAAQV
jgi:anaerobic magnesium-protoporphyrin IX monomethyl ester cyclase